MGREAVVSGLFRTGIVHASRCSWTRLLSFNLPFKGAHIGKMDTLDRDKTWYPSCRVLPMRWTSAVGVMQELAEEVLLRGGFDQERQIRLGCWTRMHKE